MLHVRLGFKKEDKVVIVNADDMGVNPAANKAISELMASGELSSASLLVTGDAYEGAAEWIKRRNLEGIGLHLTLTGPGVPVSLPWEVNTLTNEEGCFRTDPVEVECKSDPLEVHTELRNQILRAINSGINLTHMDSHQGSVLGIYSGRDFLDIVLELILEFELPFLFPRGIIGADGFTEKQKDRFSFILNCMDRMGLPVIDNILSLPYTLTEGETYRDVKERYIEALKGIGSGVTQIVLHPECADNRGLDGITNSKREMEYHLMQDEEVRQAFQDLKLQKISWRTLRDYYRCRK